MSEEEGKVGHRWGPADLRAQGQVTARPRRPLPSLCHRRCLKGPESNKNLPHTRGSSWDGAVGHRHETDTLRGDARRDLGPAGQGMPIMGEANRGEEGRMSQSCTDGPTQAARVLGPGLNTASHASPQWRKPRTTDRQ